MFWRKTFFVNVFSLFRTYLLLEKGWALHFNKLEFHSTMDVLCQILSKLVKVVLGKKILTFHVFLPFRKYLSLEKGLVLHVNKVESPSHQNALCQFWLKLAKWFWRSGQFSDRRGRKPIRQAHLSFQLMWAKNVIY